MIHRRPSTATLTDDFFFFFGRTVGLREHACALARTSLALAFLKVFVPTSLLMGLGPRERPALLVGLLGGAFFAGRLGASSNESDWPKPPKSSPPPMSKL